MPAGDNPLIVDLHLAIRNIVLIKTDMGEGGKVKFSTFEGKKKTSLPFSIYSYIAKLLSSHCSDSAEVWCISNAIGFCVDQSSISKGNTLEYIQNQLVLNPFHGDLKGSYR